MSCSQCGTAPSTPGARFCSNCGTPLIVNEATPKEEPRWAIFTGHDGTWRVVLYRATTAAEALERLNNRPAFQLYKRLPTPPTLRLARVAPGGNGRDADHRLHTVHEWHEVVLVAGNWMQCGNTAADSPANGILETTILE